VIPKLVVLSGYPYSGKTTLSSFMVDELGFLRVGIDQLIKMIYNHERLNRSFRDCYTREVRALWQQPFNDIKMQFLQAGYDTVVDSAAPFNENRRSILHTGDIPVEKYLIFLSVDPDILRQRSMQAMGREYDLQNWVTGGTWEEPLSAEELGCKDVLTYPNNTLEQTGAMNADLKRRFPRRWTPQLV